MQAINMNSSQSKIKKQFTKIKERDPVFFVGVFGLFFKKECHGI